VQNKKKPGKRGSIKCLRSLKLAIVIWAWRIQQNNRLPDYPAAAFDSTLPLSPLLQPVQEPAIGYLTTLEGARAEELIGSLLLLIPQREGEIHSPETVRSCPFSQGRWLCPPDVPAFHVGAQFIAPAWGDSLSLNKDLHFILGT
jgi:hypothetical protein